MKPAEPTTPNAWIPELVAMLEKQQSVVGRLLDLARNQGALIENRRSEPLLGLLAQRQRLVDEFTSLQGELAARTGDLPRRLQTAASADRDRIRRLIDDISAGLAEVMRHDEADQRALARARDDVKAELTSQGAVRQARTAYTSPGYTASRFADRQG